MGSRPQNGFRVAEYEKSFEAKAISFLKKILKIPNCVFTLVFEDVSPNQFGFCSGFARLLNLELHVHGHLQLVSRAEMKRY